MKRNDQKCQRPKPAGFTTAAPQPGHAFVLCLQYPTIAFLYFAGWLGWSGSKYLQAVKNDPKPIEKEIIIDVPLVSFMHPARRFGWRWFAVMPGMGCFMG